MGPAGAGRVEVASMAGNEGRTDRDERRRVATKIMDKNEELAQSRGYEAAGL